MFTKHIELDTNERVASDLGAVLEVIAEYPKNLREILKGMIYAGRSSAEMAATLGCSQSEIEADLAVALLALKKVRPHAFGGSHRAAGYDFRPFKGAASAMHATAKYLEETGHPHEATIEWVRGAFTADALKDSPDAVSAYRAAAKEFRRQARAGGRTDDDRRALGAAAALSLLHGVSIAEMIGDGRARGLIHAELVDALLEQDDVDMAKVHAELAIRSARGHDNPALESHVRLSLGNWHMVKARGLKAGGRLGSAEEHAKRAWKYCVGVMSHEAEEAESLLEEIDSLVGRVDAQARAQQLSESVRKSATNPPNLESIADEVLNGTVQSAAAAAETKRRVREQPQHKNNGRSDFESDMI